MATREIVFYPVNGHLPPVTQKQIDNICARMEGRKLALSIREHKLKRSLQQNAFHFGVVVPMVRQMFLDEGNNITQDETHAFIKQHVWRHVKHIRLPDGQLMEVPETSTKLTTSEWEQNIEKTRAWAAEFGLEIPLPNEEQV